MEVNTLIEPKSAQLGVNCYWLIEWILSPNQSLSNK